MKGHDSREVAGMARKGRGEVLDGNKRGVKDLLKGGRRRES